MKNMKNVIQDVKKIMEEIIGNDKQKTNNDTKQSTISKKIVHLVGDSHIRYMKQEINKQNTNEIIIKENFRPGATIKNITEDLLPQNYNDNDIMVLSGGTNDLYKSTWEEIKLQLDKINQMKCRIIMILIPPQNNNNNKDIVRLNTLIKHNINNFKNIDIIDPNKFIKPWHLAIDGIHLGRKGKTWLCTKIIEKINSENSRIEKDGKENGNEYQKEQENNLYRNTNYNGQYNYWHMKKGRQNERNNMYTYPYNKQWQNHKPDNHTDWKQQVYGNKWNHQQTMNNKTQNNEKEVWPELRNRTNRHGNMNIHEKRIQTCQQCRNKIIQNDTHPKGQSFL